MDIEHLLVGPGLQWHLERDEIITLPIPTVQVPATYGLRVWRSSAEQVVAFGYELPWNRGRSVTNTANEIAHRVWLDAGQPEQFAWLEWYSTAPDRFDLVQFPLRTSAGFYGEPTWTPFWAAQMQGLLGCDPNEGIV